MKFSSVNSISFNLVIWIDFVEKKLNLKKSIQHNWKILYFIDKTLRFVAREKNIPFSGSKLFEKPVLPPAFGSGCLKAASLENWTGKKPVWNANQGWQRTGSIPHQGQSERWQRPGNPYWRGRLSTVDLLVLTSLDQLVKILKTLFTFLQSKLP